MSQELHLEVDIIPGKIIREKNGMAMSSRNIRLSKTAKKEALILSKTLFKVKEKWEQGYSIPDITIFLKESLKHQNIEYAGLYDPETLRSLHNRKRAQNALVAIAGWFDGIRLIDNILLEKDHLTAV